MKYKVFKIGLSLLYISLISISCTTQTSITGTSPSPGSQPAQPVIRVGAEVDVKFVNSFEPKPTAGTKITVISSSPGIEPKELTTEITAVDGDILTVKITDPDGTKELKGKNEDFQDDLPQTGIKYEGKEDVKVPAGEYKGATKVSFTNSLQTKVQLWLVQGIGPVKRIDTLVDGRIVTTELKEFKN